MTQDVRQLLQHQHFDLVHRAAELKVAQIQAWREALLTSLVIGKYLLFGERQRQPHLKILFVFIYPALPPTPAQEAEEFEIKKAANVSTGDSVSSVLDSQSI